MSSPTLLNVTPDELFEKYNITEIEDIHKKLQNEIELKREELRAMVGERYRDLLKAADTIGDMKTTAGSVIDHVERVMKSCRNLNEQQLIGFKTAPTYNTGSSKNTVNNFYSIVVQIKILTLLPELIWSHLDREEYFIATQLFIFSRHISTGLQLDANNIIMKHFPVANKQWTILNPFFFTIKQICSETLERTLITSEIASKCLASLMLLELCDVDKLLNIFMRARMKAFINILSDDENFENVRSKILQSLKILIHTVGLLFECFIDSGNGLGNLMNELVKLINHDSRPTIEMIDFSNKTIINTLPDIIAKFRPQVKMTELKVVVLKATTFSWLQDIENIFKTQIKSLINLITTVKTIHEIRKSVQDIEKSKKWDIMCQKLYLPPNIDFFKLFYQPLINDRIKEIVKDSWNAALNETKLEINELIKNDDNSIKKFVWSEDITDIPLSLKDALSIDKHSHKLLMKTKGFTPNVVALCNSLDKNLENLYNDLYMYLSNEKDLNKPNLPQVTSNEQNADLNLFLKATTQESITDLITYIKSTDFNKKSQNYIILARVLHAIPELCPNFKLCLSNNLIDYDKYSTNLLNEGTLSEQWITICKLLEEESLQLWKIGINLFYETISNEFKYLLNTDITLNTIMKDFPKWEIIKIEEQDEHDNKIESTILVPSQPSIKIQLFLYKFCKKLNNLSPNTIPKSIILHLILLVINDLCLYYTNLTENQFVKNNQTASLQYFFDIKYIVMILIPRENTYYNEKMQNLTNIFKTFIDPFDFELFHKYIINNVKKSSIRMQQQLGSIIINSEYLSTLVATQTLQTQDREPNIVPLSSNVSTTAWFPMLPIMSTGNINESLITNQTAVQFDLEKDVSINKTKKQESTRTAQATPLSTTQNYASNVKSGAAAFFGAMSQDWFRSS